MFAEVAGWLPRKCARPRRIRYRRAVCQGPRGRLRRQRLRRFAACRQLAQPPQRWVCVSQVGGGGNFDQARETLANLGATFSNIETHAGAT